MDSNRMSFSGVKRIPGVKKRYKAVKNNCTEFNNEKMKVQIYFRQLLIFPILPDCFRQE